MNFSPQEIYLSSKYATLYVNGTTDLSDMLFYFDHPITKPVDYNISLRVSSFVFPVSFTLVNEDNNKLIIGSTTYTLTSANYNALSLKSHLLTLLPSGFSITYNSTTEKYTFSYSSDFTISSESTCLTLLGFTNGIDHTSSSSTLTSDTMINLSGTNVIYVDIPNVSTSNLSSKTGMKTSIIKSIAINVAPASVMFYDDTTSSSVFLQEEALSFFHIRC